MTADPNYIKGRGAQINTPDPFAKYINDSNPLHAVDEGQNQLATQYTLVHPKTIVNKVKSPDIPMDFSANPYQGCEHGCVYCYARNTHPFWGYSAGFEFEQRILYKNKAPQLLEEQLKNKRWKAKTIMLSGNTDCYQPIERALKITRKMLEVFWKYRHPVGIITKNSLVLRDLDILEKLAAHNLVRVAISITTLDEKLRSLLEPRTVPASRRLETIEQLSKAGIPVYAMMAPIIPGLNDHEILAIAKKSAELGARSFGHSIVRLNGDVATIFTDWVLRTYPDRAAKILNKIEACHGGSLGDKRSGVRMKGEGNIAKIINDQVVLAKKKYFAEALPMPVLNTEMHQYHKTPQLRLF